MRYRLELGELPLAGGIWYKDEGGRDKCIENTLRLVGAAEMAGVMSLLATRLLGQVVPAAGHWSSPSSSPASRHRGRLHGYSPRAPYNSSNCV